MDNINSLAEASNIPLTELRAYVESLGYTVDEDGFISLLNNSEDL
jgi:hypothetical protein